MELSCQNWIDGGTKCWIKNMVDGSTPCKFLHQKDVPTKATTFSDAFSATKEKPSFMFGSVHKHENIFLQVAFIKGAWLIARIRTLAQSSVAKRKVHKCSSRLVNLVTKATSRFWQNFQICHGTFNKAKSKRLKSRNSDFKWLSRLSKNEKERRLDSVGLLQSIKH